MADPVWLKELIDRGYDLTNPRLSVDVIAPEVVEAVRPTIAAFEQVGDIITESFQSIAALGAITSIVSVVGTVASVVTTALGILENVSGRWAEEATKNEIKARDLLFEAVWKPGAWRGTVKYKGPDFGDLDLKDQIGGWSTSEFLAQYEPPGSIFMRPAGARDFVVATYPTFAYEAPYGVVRDAVVTPGDNVNGHPEMQSLLGMRPRVPPVPEGYGWNYICEAPGSSPSGGTIERVISNYRCAPVPGSGTFFSWGTYPWLGPLGEPYQLGPKGIATCLAMQAPTPVWAAIREKDVVDAYWYWNDRSRFRSIPLAPPRQLGPMECVLDSEYLPFSNSEQGIFTHNGQNVLIHVPRYRAIETAFRRFFALRNLARRNPEALPPSLKPAIEANPDFKLPLNPRYRWADPLGNWFPEEKPPPQAPPPKRGLPPKPKTPPPKRKGRVDAPAVSPAFALAATSVTGAAALAYANRAQLVRWLRSLRNRR